MRFLLVFILGVLIAGCGKPTGKVKGAPPKGDPRTILAVKAGDTPLTVTIEGNMVEKCPAAGCWFKIEGGGDVIKVDTKAAGFVVTDIPLQTKITVGGKVVQEGSETIIEATGIRY